MKEKEINLVKRFIATTLTIVLCSQLVACTYTCDVCGKEKFGFGGTSIEYGGRVVNVCKSCKDTIVGAVKGISGFFQ